MPRQITPQLQAHLEGEELTLAVCARLERKDGVIFGFTTLNVDLTIDGLTYKPTASMSPSAVKQETGSGIDNLEVLGVLSDDAITDEDLVAGRYDYAKIQLFMVNWEDLSQGKLLLFSGSFGEITLRDGAYTAELRSLSNQLKQAIGDITTAGCRVRRLGDNQCKADFPIDNVTITEVVSPMEFKFASARAEGWYEYGVLTITSGDNEDLQREVKNHHLAGGVATVTLREAFPFALTVGTTLTAEPGCDRTLTTCKDKFNNTINYHGEPYLPGNQKIIQVGRPPG